MDSQRPLGWRHTHTFRRCVSLRSAYGAREAAPSLNQFNVVLSATQQQQQQQQQQQNKAKVTASHTSPRNGNNDRSKRHHPRRDHRHKSSPSHASDDASLALSAALAQSASSHRRQRAQASPVTKKPRMTAQRHTFAPLPSYNKRKDAASSQSGKVSRAPHRVGDSATELSISSTALPSLALPRAVGSSSYSRAHANDGSPLHSYSPRPRVLTSGTSFSVGVQLPVVATTSPSPSKHAQHLPSLGPNFSLNASPTRQRVVAFATMSENSRNSGRFKGHSPSHRKSSDVEDANVPMPFKPNSPQGVVQHKASRASRASRASGANRASDKGGSESRGAAQWRRSSWLDAGDGNSVVGVTETHLVRHHSNGAAEVRRLSTAQAQREYERQRERRNTATLIVESTSL